MVQTAWFLCTSSCKALARVHASQIGPLLPAVAAKQVLHCHGPSSLSLVFCLARHFSSSRTQIFTNPEALASRATKGTPSEHGMLIYTGRTNGMVKRLKYVSLATSLFGLAMQPMFIEKAAASAKSATVILSFAGFFGTVAIVTPLALNFLTKRYITELHFDASKKLFTAYTLNLLNRRRCTTFTASDVGIPPAEGPFTSFLVFKKPYLVDPSQFSDAAAYKHLMGHDKPLEEEELLFSHEKRRREEKKSP